jgi:hypothetical protein
MSRNLSVTFVETIQALATGDAAIFLLTISHPSFAETIRVCNNRTDMTSRGNLFRALAFDISLAIDDSKTLPSMALTLDNVDRNLIREIRELPDGPDFLMELILASNPEQVELGFPEMTVSAITYDANTIRTNVVVSDMLNRKYPRGTATPASNPGMF